MELVEGSLSLNLSMGGVAHLISQNSLVHAMGLMELKQYSHGRLRLLCCADTGGPSPFLNTVWFML